MLARKYSVEPGGAGRGYLGPASDLGGVGSLTGLRGVRFAVSLKQLGIQQKRDPQRKARSGNRAMGSEESERRGPQQQPARPVAGTPGPVLDLGDGGFFTGLHGVPLGVFLRD